MKARVTAALAAACALAIGCATPAPNPERERFELKNEVVAWFRTGLQKIGRDEFAKGFTLETGAGRFSWAELAGLAWPVYPREEMLFIVRKSEVRGEAASLSGWVTLFDQTRHVEESYYYAACRADIERRGAAWKLKRVALAPIAAYQYALRLPAAYDAAGKYPLLVFLHGAHLRGDNVKLVETESEFRFTKLTDKLDQFVIALPQCPAETVWLPSLVMRTIEKIKSERPGDDDRIYLMGNSLGGAGTWGTAVAYPRFFAAIAPICGPVFSTDGASAIAGLPVWVFHGGKDPVVPPGHSQAMVDRLKALGSATVRFTVYANEGHDIATKVADTAELYDWLLAHRRKP